jgi:hypothetical protein
MTNNDLVVIATYANNFEADIMKSALEAAAIESLIQGEDCEGFRPDSSKDRGIKLLVQSNDARNAEEVLNTAQLRPVKRVRAHIERWKAGVLTPKAAYTFKRRSHSRSTSVFDFLLLHDVSN